MVFEVDLYRLKHIVDELQSEKRVLDNQLNEIRGIYSFFLHQTSGLEESYRPILRYIRELDESSNQLKKLIQSLSLVINQYSSSENRVLSEGNNECIRIQIPNISYVQLDRIRNIILRLL